MNILCFGEPLIRLATNGHERLEDTRQLDVSYGGAESVVAISLALQGEKVSFASRVSDNRLGTNALMNLARYGIDTSRVTRSNSRMGLYYTERGSSIRPTVVTYDRKGTAMDLAKTSDFDWDRMLNGIELFFFSGVMPAISDEMFQACVDGLKACAGRGIRTVLDLNYRVTMWPREKALPQLGKLLPYVDHLIASEDDILALEGAHVEAGDVFDYSLSWAKAMRRDYGLTSVSFVVRQMDRYDTAVIRGGMVDANETYLGASQQVTLTDLSSCGSVFSAAIVHGCCSSWDFPFVVEYATMASAFKATIAGDLSYATETEIAGLLASGSHPHILQ